MPWKPLDVSRSQNSNEKSASTSIGESVDTLQALGSLLSATSGNSSEANSSDPSANLSSLLETLASFSAQLNATSNDEGTNQEEIGRQEISNSSSNVDIASLLLAGLANVKSEQTSSAVDEFERYEREREQKYRDLEAKFSFLAPPKPKPKPSPKNQQAGHSVFSASPQVEVSSSPGMDSLAAAREILTSSAVKQFLTNFQMKQSVPVSTTKKPVGHKRRARSSSTSSSSSSRSGSSSGSASRSDRSAKEKKKSDRKKKMKKLKAKKEKQKNGKNSFSKVKKSVSGAEKNAVSDRVNTLKTNLADYEKRRNTLEEELGRLKKQHNEMCRKLQRQKSDPKKDPLIIDNEGLQNDIERHLRVLEKQKETDQKALETEEKNLDKLKKLTKETKKDGASSSTKRAATESTGDSPSKKPKQENNEGVQYFDPGSHWCRYCNSTSANVYEWLEHLHSQKHKTSIDILERPWAQAKAQSQNQVVSSLKPLKGAEFLFPSTAFYCSLCNEFSGDSLCAEEHLKSASHNAKYQAYVESNPFYERREMLEKAAAVTHRLEKSASASANTSKSSIVDNQKSSSHRRLAESSVSSRPFEPQRIPHKPNESGKIKPFHVSSSSSGDTKDKRNEKREERPSTSKILMKVDLQKSSTSSSTTLKKPHSAFEDPRERSTSSSNTLKKPHSAFEDSRERSKRDIDRYSDRKRHYDR